MSKFKVGDEVKHKMAQQEFPNHIGIVTKITKTGRMSIKWNIEQIDPHGWDNLGRFIKFHRDVLDIVIYKVSKLHKVLK